MVKASELIEKIREGNIKAEVVDDEDLRPYLSCVSIDVDDEDHICSLTAYVSYSEDSPRNGTDSGQSEAVVLGISFVSPVINGGEEIEIYGEIDYDDDFEEEDIIDAAQEYIEWPVYNSDDYAYDDTPDVYEILEKIDCPDGEFALNSDDEICFFKDGEFEYERVGDGEASELVAKLPEGYTLLDYDEALERLVKEKCNDMYYIEDYN